MKTRNTSKYDVDGIPPLKESMFSLTTSVSNDSRKYGTCDINSKRGRT